jgi:hypothetical protein
MVEGRGMTKAQEQRLMEYLWAMFCMELIALNSPIEAAKINNDAIMFGTGFACDELHVPLEEIYVQA